MDHKPGLLPDEAPPEAQKYTVVEEVADKLEESSNATGPPNSTTSKASKRQISSSYRQSVQIKSGKQRSFKSKKTTEQTKEDAVEKTYQKEIANYRKSIMNSSLSLRSAQDSLTKQSNARPSIRKSIAGGLSNSISGVQSTSVRKSIIKRASISFMEGVEFDSSDLKIENERLQTTISVLNGKLKSQADTEQIIASLREKNKVLEDENQMLKSEVSSHKSTIESLEKSLEENKKHCEQLKVDLEESEEARKDLKIQIDELTMKFVTLEEELFESKTIQLELLDKVAYLEPMENIQELYIQEKEKVAEYEKKFPQPIYIFHKDDPIDTMLGNYLNLYPERKKLKIMFLRESEGVYLFGKKRIHIKVEQGNSIKVRVGGGFIDIGEFIERYTTQEVEKVEKQDGVLDRFLTKTAIQHIAIDSANEARELSPIRSPQRPKTRGTSPKVRASKQRLYSSSTQMHQINLKKTVTQQSQKKLKTKAASKGQLSNSVQNHTFDQKEQSSQEKP